VTRAERERERKRDGDTRRSECASELTDGGQQQQQQQQQQRYMLDREIDLPSRERHDLPGVSPSPSLARISAAPSDVKL